MTLLPLRVLPENHVQHLLYFISPNLYIHRCVIWGNISFYVSGDVPR